MKRFIFLALALVLIVGITAGCGLVRRPAPAPAPQQPQPNQPFAPQQPPPQQQPQPGIEGQQNLVEQVTQQAEQVDGVGSASAIITGNLAIVGISLEEGGDEEAVKREVNQQIEALPGITEAVSTADPELVNRIQQTARRIADGRPTSEVLGEIMEIWERLRPRS
jgi:YhcN/YlaJ family sporulation lipoprotein